MHESENNPETTPLLRALPAPTLPNFCPITFITFLENEGVTDIDTDNHALFQSSISVQLWQYLRRRLRHVPIRPQRNRQLSRISHISQCVLQLLCHLAHQLRNPLVIDDRIYRRALDGVSDIMTDGLCKVFRHAREILRDPLDVLEISHMQRLEAPVTVRLTVGRFSRKTLILVESFVQAGNVRVGVNRYTLWTRHA